MNGMSGFILVMTILSCSLSCCNSALARLRGFGEWGTKRVGPFEVIIDRQIQ